MRETSPPTLREENPTLAAYAALAAGYLGRMYLRGEGVKADAATAQMWFQRGVDLNEKESFNGLAIILRDGLVDGRKDLKKAMKYFTAAANQELAEAAVNLGKIYYGEHIQLRAEWRCVHCLQTKVTSRLRRHISRMRCVKARRSKHTITSRQFKRRMHGPTLFRLILPGAHVL